MAAKNLRREYMRLYNAADAILRAPGNPCEIQQDANGNTTCRKYRESNPKPSGYRSGPADLNTLCCTGCRHLGPDGCTVAALGCKLGWCYTSNNAILGMRVNDHPVFVAIAELRKEAVALGVPLEWRTDMEESFELSAQRKRHFRA